MQTDEASPEKSGLGMQSDYPVSAPAQPGTSGLILVSAAHPRCSRNWIPIPRASWLQRPAVRVRHALTRSNVRSRPTRGFTRRAWVCPGGCPKDKPPPVFTDGGLGIKTLAMTYSRMAKPHYHRRGCVSLPSSEWDRVVPHRYGHQGEGGGSLFSATLSEVTGHAFRRERNKLDVASSECRDVSRSQGHFSKLRFWKPLEVIWSSHTDH